MKTITIEELVALVKRMGQKRGVVNVDVYDAGMSSDYSCSWVDDRGVAIRDSVGMESVNVRVPREEDAAEWDCVRGAIRDLQMKIGEVRGRLDNDIASIRRRLDRLEAFRNRVEGRDQ